MFPAVLHFLPHIRWELKTLPLSKCLGLVSVIPSPYLNVSWIFQNMLTMLEWSAFQLLLLRSDCLYGYVNLFPLPALTFFLLCVLYGGSWDDGSRQQGEAAMKSWGQMCFPLQISWERRMRKFLLKWMEQFTPLRAVVTSYIYVSTNIHLHLVFLLNSGHPTVMNRSFHTFLKSLLFKGQFLLSAI